MSISRKLKNAASGSSDGGGGSAGGYVDDVFSTYVYAGASGKIDIVNGIDLAGQGGLVWTKARTASMTLRHYLHDTERGAGKRLSTDGSDRETDSAGDISAFNSDGYQTGGGAATGNPSDDYVSWTFRKAPSFFDVVTYTGDGVAGREIPHNLGCEPGMIITKLLNVSDNWGVYHASLGGTKRLALNDTSAASTTSRYWNDTDATDSVFTVGIDDATNGPANGAAPDGKNYVAYLFAHDDSDESMIKCGSYTGNGNNDGPEIDLGWEPQYILLKNADTGGNGFDWYIFDCMRGMAVNGPDVRVRANDAEAESGAGKDSILSVTATGFKIDNASPAYNGTNMIYMAIRRPNKPAEEFEPEELFALWDPSDYTPSNPRMLSGFPVDMAWHTSGGGSNFISSRFIQDTYLTTDTSSAAVSSPGKYSFDYMNGWLENYSTSNQNGWMFRRAPGFFDVVTYAGDGASTTRDIPHNLTAVPEMLWVKGTSSPGNWAALFPGLFDQYGTERSRGDLNEVYSFNSFGTFFGTPTDTNFGVGPSLNWNTAGVDYIAYLFASLPGICDIGSFTGTGGDQDIDCGFTNGARFVLIKRADASGDWMFFDTLRGISASDSPMLKLNEKDAQVTGSYIKPLNSGFTVTSNLTGISGAEYIYMAIA